MFSYKKASLDELDKIWDKDIEENRDDKRYITWKKEFIDAASKGDIVTFVILCDDDPIGQCSIVINKNNIKNPCRDLLCDGENKVYLSTLRIEKQFEGQGHISKLVKVAEKYAKDRGFSSITIGSEAQESRNLAIYLHFGYTKFVTSCVEDNSLILFYEKSL